MHICQAARDRVTVEAGKPDVQHHDMRCEHPHGSKRLVAVADGLDLMSLEAQERRRALRRVDVVVDHEHAPAVDLLAGDRRRRGGELGLLPHGADRGQHDPEARAVARAVAVRFDATLV